MSGLEALGLACNIFQVISFGLEVVRLTEQVYKNGTVDEALQSRSDILQNISSSVQNVDVSKSKKKGDRDLMQVAKKCEVISRGLREEIAFILGQSAQGSLAKTLKVAAKTTWRRRRLDRLEKELSAIEKQMQTGLLARIFDSTAVIEQKLDAADVELRSFVRQYQAGNRHAKDLITRNSQSINQHTTSEIDRANKENANRAQEIANSMKQHFSSTLETYTTQTTTLMKSLRVESDGKLRSERLISSLKFERMNERRNDSKTAYPKTFTWLFEEGSDSDHDSDYEVESSDSNSEDSISLLLSDNSSEMSEERGFGDGKDGQSLRQIWDNFPDWLRSEERIYWITGKPGSGKTTLVKFIISHSKTTELLDIWKPNSLLVSHFFWRPGSLMQQSVKGMLCALLYQLLSGNDRSQNSLFCDLPHLGQKDSDTDWSSDELLSVLYRIIRDYDRPICVFLDGLDEVYTGDGFLKLWAIITQLHAFQNVKLCLSSRFEPILVKKLRVYPQLRVHDLILPDLMVYAHKELGPHIRGAEWCREARRRIFSLITDKAEGVFLWLCLAIEDAKEGLELGENLEQTTRRIERLPEELSKLYEDMLRRVNKDLHEYRQITARLFRLVMNSNLFHKVDGRHCPIWDDSTTVFFLMLASTSVSDELLRDQIPTVTSQEILQQCLIVEKQIYVHCAGLLHTVIDSSATGDFVYTHREDDRVFAPYADPRRRVKLIHRSAFDFLCDTEKGRELLSNDTDCIDHLILKSKMAAYKVFRAPSFAPRFLFSHYTYASLSQLLSCINLHLGYPGESDATAPSIRLRWDIIEKCRELHLGGWAPDFNAENVLGILSEPEFLELCVTWELFDYVWGYIQRSSFDKQTLTRFLCCMAHCEHERKEWRDPDLWRDRLRHSLLARGTDPNCPQRRMSLHWYNYLETPLSGVIGDLLTSYGRPRLDCEDDRELPAICRAILDFAKYGADLQASFGCNLHVQPNHVRLSPFTHFLYTEGKEIDLLMLPICTIIMCILDGILALKPELEQCLEVAEIRQLLLNSAKTDTRFTARSVPAILRTKAKGGLLLLCNDVDKIPYRVVRNDEEANRLVGAVLFWLQNRASRDASLRVRESLDACHSNTIWAHGSLFSLLRDLNLLRQRKCGDGVEHMVHTDVKWDALPQKFEAALYIPQLNAIELSGLEEHRECCKAWVSEVLESQKRFKSIGSSRG